MKSPEQLKGAIRNIAKTKNLRSQEVLQMFLCTRPNQQGRVIQG